MTRTVLIIAAAGLLMLVGTGSSIAGSAVQHTTASVRWHPQSGDPDVAIDGASATLRSTMVGASVTLRTSQLNPGHAYTLWWVIINHPEACASHPDPCTPHDVLSNTQTVQAQVTYATGHVVGDSGRATFSAHLPAGDIDGGWFPDQGFTDPVGAEIHLVVNDHGPRLDEYMPDMIGTYRGGCTDESLPPVFPATAFADGEPGPNTCRLAQTATFQQ